MSQRRIIRQYRRLLWQPIVLEFESSPVAPIVGELLPQATDEPLLLVVDLPETSNFQSLVSGSPSLSLSLATPQQHRDDNPDRRLELSGKHKA